MEISQILSLLFGAIGVCGGIGAFLNGARKDSVIAVLTKENIAIKDYNATLESTAARVTAERDGYKRQYEDARDLAQGSPQLKILTDEFTKWTATMTRQNEELKNYIKKVTK